MIAFKTLGTVSQPREMQHFKLQSLNNDVEKHFLGKNSGGLHNFVRFSKICQLLPMLESRNVNNMKVNRS